MAKAMKKDSEADKEDLEELLKRARNGDESTLGQIRKLLKDPVNVDRFGGDLALQLELNYVHKMAGNDLAFQEALTRKLASMRKELAGDISSPVDTMLLERVVTCWLHLHHAELVYVQSSDLTIVQARYHQERIDRAHRRFLTAAKTLATVRKLALPILIGQVNVAENQVNVANQST